jgi:alpha-L-rhamnosidase
MLSGDTRLSLKALDDFHSSLTPYGLLQSRAPSESPNIIPVFSLYWIFMLHDYYWQTGDLSAAKRYRPSMDAILDWFERHLGKYGLVENLYYWEFIDWVDGWNCENGNLDAIPYAAKKGPCVATNLIYAYALLKAAELEVFSERPYVATEYKKKAEKILLNVEKYCWSEEKEMYREGPEVEEYTQHSQALAVLTGLATGERAKAIMKNCFKDNSVKKCTYAFMYLLFRALEKSDLYDLTEELWEYWSCNKEVELTTWPEDFTKQRSDCHAWGSLPIYEFTRCVLGVQPECPGWEKIIIKPICNYLDSASGSVMTKHGKVTLDWQNKKGSWSMRGSVPQGVPYRVELPDGKVWEGIGCEEFELL